MRSMLRSNRKRVFVLLAVRGWRCQLLGLETGKLVATSGLSKANSTLFFTENIIYYQVPTRVNLCVLEVTGCS